MYNLSGNMELKDQYGEYFGGEDDGSNGSTIPN